ncbi:MAG: phosphate acyltransferase PlsX [Halanaerobiales bacterium]|nr:phosphate acyltransferase PlsX [Halanaerobiales bacterium]
MRIVLDVMGGDFIPHVPVEGAIQAVKDFSDIHVILVGFEDKIKEELSKYEYPKERISIVHASEIIEMNDAPATAIRRKKDSSIVVGANLVKKGEADAFVSAGNTGACMSAGVLKIGRIKGINRPGIATVFPNINDQTVVLDIGANVDIGSEELVQFAFMGKIFAEKVLNKPNPRIGLLSIGAEEHKGNQLTHETYPLLRNAPINFIGNVEGRDIFNGSVDVIVCDGFVGNVVLKTAEGLFSIIRQILKEEATKNLRTMLGGLLMKPAINGLKERLDYTEYGGSPLLGVKGITIIAHGSSNAWAIRNAIRVARDSLVNNVVGEIENNISEGVMKIDH